MYKLKAGNGWSDKSFKELLELIKEMLLEPNEKLKSLYEAKKVMHNLDMNYEKYMLATMIVFYIRVKSMTG